MKYHKIEEIIAYLDAERAGVEAQFDAKYKERLDELFTELVRLFNGLQDAMYNSIEKKLPDGTCNAALILWKCLRTFLASIQLLRAGYWGEANSLLRDALESAAIALYLHNHPESNSVFQGQGGKPLYGKALGEAYKIIPTFQTQRKLLSEIYVHPSEFHGVIEWKGEKFSMVGTFEEKNLQRYETTVFVLESVIKDLGKVIEYIFFVFFDPPLFWDRDGSGKLTMKSPGLKHLNRLLDSAEIIKKNTGIDILADSDDDNDEAKEYKAILRRYELRRKSKES
ncbi:TPA: hypothetical protein DCL30_01000 [Candidatus Peribacteria bacterium]|nr:MAG: hypothetical protein A3J91_02890 [Candidatus Peribacteria bacterium RIFOXYC2_FULL_58_10]OGJ85157.1 MAG: hypothetical protein A2529_01695 [Candidatus Peribacteria bacterium RIFOXYD2_FULL_58_15]HAI98106.1 hypothetical protein [Candidatus Peribacteria bacterium]HAS33853.1 hypothetical protein [Candidatus Peribacteria bacterium]